MIELTSIQQEAAGHMTRCYFELSQKNSNVVFELMQGAENPEHWQHFPKGDVKDKQNHTQYYYHAHPSKDEDRVPEHGHFHLFFQPGVIENQAPLVISEKYQESNGQKDNLTHVLAIAMNEQGLPTALFTVNYWVTLGIWYPADAIINVLDRFVVNRPDSPFALTNQWISSMMVLFQDTIKELLYARDVVIKEQQQQFPDKNVFYDKSLEVTSLCRF